MGIDTTTMSNTSFVVSVLCLHLVLADDWVWNRGSMAMDEQVSRTDIKQKHSKLALARCREEIAKLCSQEIKRAQAKEDKPALPRGEKDDKDWTDELVHEIGLCVNDKADQLSIHCKVQDASTVDWHGYQPSNYRTRVQEAVDAGTKDAILRAKLLVNTEYKKSAEEIAKVDQEMVQKVLAAQKKAEQDIATVKAKAADEIYQIQHDLQQNATKMKQNATKAGVVSTKFLATAKEKKARERAAEMKPPAPVEN